MPSSERPDALAAPDADETSRLPAVANGDVDPQRALDAASEPAPQSEGADGADSPERSSPPTHKLLETESSGKDRGRTKSVASESQLVSGDPLLLGPAPAKSAPVIATPPATSVPPKTPKPPPPPVDKSPSRQARPATDLSTSTVATVPGLTSPSAAQPARRASRGAQVTAPRAAVPTRPPEQPVTTLRPTTVAPVPRLAGRRPRVRRVTRVVRHVDPWSVFKVAAAFSIVAYAIALIAGVLLWNVAYATGTIDNIERGMESTGWEVFELDGGEIFHNAWIGGLFGAVALTGLAVLTATLFNLITDLVGGIRMTVLEEEVVEKTASPMRRFATSTTRRSAPPSAEVTGSQGAEARVRRARGG